eukprot:COSAG03_NODE_364_length_8537_cov_5.229557_7_plen_178_part_00
MAAGGRNPQKSAMARAKRQAKDAEMSRGGGGAAAMAERRGAGMDAKLAETQARKAAVAERAAEKKKKEEMEAEKARKKAEREAKERAKEEQKAGGDQKLKEVEAQFTPLVKKGGQLQDAGDLEGALALYQEALDGFKSNGFKRPKLKEKLDEVKAKLAETAAPEPEIDQSVEVEEEC